MTVTIRHVFKMDFKFSFGLWSIYNVRNTNNSIKN